MAFLVFGLMIALTATPRQHHSVGRLALLLSNFKHVHDRPFPSPYRPPSFRPKLSRPQQMKGASTLFGPRIARSHLASVQRFALRRFLDFLGEAWREATLSLPKTPSD
jgi:hypothetical protein